MSRLSKKRVLFIAMILGICTLHAFREQERNVTQAISGHYRQQLEAMRATLLRFKADIATGDKTLWIADLKECRKAYKRAEIIIGSQYPLMAHRFNGPDLMEAEAANPNESVLPTGFQVMETDVFSEDGPGRKKQLLRQLDNMITYTDLLHSLAPQLQLDEAMLYDALRMNLNAMASLGLSGFDTPLLGCSLEEAKVSLEETGVLLQVTGVSNEKLQAAINLCVRLLDKKGTSFEKFNRGYFLVKGWRPLMLQLYRQQQESHIPFVSKRSAIRSDAAGFLEADAFDPYFFAPDGLHKANEPLVALGKALFSEPALSASGRSCATCHRPGLAYTDGLMSNSSLQRDERLPRNTPTLINAALQPVLFADERVQYLEEQAHEVILNKQEMDGHLPEVVLRLAASLKYRRLFSEAFGDSGSISQDRILMALAAFERSLIRLNAPFDRYMRGDSLAMTRQQQRGFDLFMGKAKCGTCHFMPLFNGAMPPFYDRQDAEIIGVPSAEDRSMLDRDLGVYDLFHFPIKKGAFKTPTLRNAALTAPYMHNGIYKTLDEVIDFYDKGGGTGLGIAMDLQTLPGDKLNLKPEEKKALIAFIKALSDN